MKRRYALTTLVTGGLSLLAKSAAALTNEKNHIVLPPLVATKNAGEIQVSGLPPGIIEIEPIVEYPDGTREATGEVFEALVTDKGTTNFVYRPSQILRGLWQVYKPGTTITNKLEPRRPFYDGHFPGRFEVYGTNVIDPNNPSVAWMYRNPADYPGSELRGIDQSNMVLWVNTREVMVPTIHIRLVDLVAAPKTYQDLQRIPFSATSFPPIQDVLQEWIFPPGRGFHSYSILPFKISPFSRWLALELVEKISAPVFFRLASLPKGTIPSPGTAHEFGLLEIGATDRPTFPLD